MLLLLACAPEPTPVADRDLAPQATAQRVRATLDTTGGHVAMHVLVTDESGAAVDCDTGSLSVVLEVSDSSDSGPWESVPVEDTLVRCSSAGGGDLALVVDNSGSEAAFLEPLAASSRAMAEGVLGAGGRVSLTRVSTNTSQLAPLTDDAATIGTALDNLHVSNGWTALWDGIRAGRETLSAAEPAGLEDFCDASSRLGVVAFTDGQDNNSADEQDYDHDAYPGDGIDTTVDDLVSLGVDGSTPVYTVGLGADVDEAALTEVAEATGGRHLSVADEGDIEGVFDQIATYFDTTSQVCADVPDATCGTLWVRATVTWEGGEETVTSTSTTAMTLDCDGEATGSSAVMLLTLQNPGIGTDLAEALAVNAVAYTAPVEDPKVLVVLDDNHHDEYATDAAWVAGLLAGAGYDVTYAEEPASGLRMRDLRAYDVVWFSNPGYPMDDGGTFEALESFAGSGGGVVLQGDDMAWTWTGDFSTRSLTHLDFASNGTDFCGVWTDNNAGSNYRVTFGAGHPLVEGIAGQEFLYGDDIDSTTPRGEGETVLATATLDGSSDCATVPVLVAWEPTTP